MKRSTKCISIAALSFQLVISSALEAQPTAGKRMVVIGRDGGEADACGGLAKVTGLKAEGDGFLAVRAAPSVKVRILDNLSMRQLVFVCEKSDDKQWLGVVYRKGDFDDVSDCLVSSPADAPRPHKGPCASGWVSGRFLEFVAG
jgi:hypothetical protein